MFEAILCWELARNEVTWINTIDIVFFKWCTSYLLSQKKSLSAQICARAKVSTLVLLQDVKVLFWRRCSCKVQRICSSFTKEEVCQNEIGRWIVYTTAESEMSQRISSSYMSPSWAPLWVIHLPNKQPIGRSRWIYQPNERQWFKIVGGSYKFPNNFNCFLQETFKKFSMPF